MTAPAGHQLSPPYAAHGHKIYTHNIERLSFLINAIVHQMHFTCSQIKWATNKLVRVCMLIENVIFIEPTGISISFRKIEKKKL